MEWCEVMSYDGIKTLVDIAFLRASPFVQDEESRIFRWITGLEEHPSMKKEDNTTIPERFQRMFVEYHVYNRDWKHLMAYLITQDKTCWAKESKRNLVFM